MIYCMYFSVYHIQYHTSNFSTSTHNVSREKKIIRSTRMCKYKLKFYDSTLLYFKVYYIKKHNGENNTTDDARRRRQGRIHSSD